MYPVHFTSWWHSTARLHVLLHGHCKKYNSNWFTSINALPKENPLFCQTPKHIVGCKATWAFLGSGRLWEIVSIWWDLYTHRTKQKKNNSLWGQYFPWATFSIWWHILSYVCFLKYAFYVFIYSVQFGHFYNSGIHVYKNLGRGFFHRFVVEFKMATWVLVNM